MSHTKLLRLLLVACIATAAFAPRAAEALAPGTLASHHTQYYYSNSRAPCTTRGVGAAPGACAGTTVISYRPVSASTTYTPRYVPLFGGLSAPWSRPVVAPLAPACGPCPPACPAPPQPDCCNTLRIVPITCYRTVYCRQQVIVHQPVTTYDPCGGCATVVMKPTTTYRMVAQRVPYTTYRLRVVKVCRGPAPSFASGNCATGNCATGIAIAGGPPHEVTRIVDPSSPAGAAAEHESQKAPAEAKEKQPAAEKKPADANPASAPRLNDPRDRLTMLPVRRIAPAPAPATDAGWQAAGR